MSVPDPRERFSNRVDAYVRSRPSYPPGVLRVLEEAGALGRDKDVADVGSGTGIFTRLLLGRCRRVWAVEPNEPMRRAAEEALGGEAGFASVDGGAEATTLPAASVDLVTAAQAFHWFRPDAFRAECARILRPGGAVALLWNQRLTDATPFLAGFEELLLRHGTDYARVRHEHVDHAALGAFFGPSGFSHAEAPNAQHFDWRGLEDRVRSASYTPAPGQPGFDTLMDALRTLFDAHSQAGRVSLLYTTHLYWGRVG
jgi:SAM-dependent methyltransferase